MPREIFTASVIASALRTARLRLETLGPDHARALLAYRVRNREQVARWEPTAPDDSFAMPWMERHIAASTIDIERGTCARFLAFEADGTSVVASVNVWNIRYGAAEGAEIGYPVDVDREGRGFATEAAAATIAHAFDVLGLHRVETSYQPTNERSARVPRKLGFIVEGYARHYLFLGGVWRDGVFVSLTNPAGRPRPADRSLPAPSQRNLTLP